MIEKNDRQTGSLRLIGDIETVMRIREHGYENGHLIFRGDLKISPARAARFLIIRLRRYGFTPFLSREEQKEEGVCIRIAPLKKRNSRRRPFLHVSLFVATFFTTLIAWSWVNEHPFSEILSHPRVLAEGLPFSLSLLVILGLHELSHYFISRYHGIKVSLPYFIPFPNILGTMGAVIVGRSAFVDRKSLFDVGIAGPLASFFLSIIALWFGLQSSAIVRPVITSRTIFIGESFLYHYICRLRFPSVPPGYTYSVTPMMFAGWVGLFVTALNLLPMGQLDGGHISYALFGKRHRKISIAVMVGITLIGLIFGSLIWILIGILVLLLGLGHTPPLDDITPLGPVRISLAVFALLILLACFPPIPLAVY